MVDQKQQVLNWLKAGAIWKDGVSLFKQIFGADHPFLLLIKKGGNQIKYEILKQALQNFANKQPTQLKLRDEFTFLNEAKCPAELKVLAADKITAFHAYRNAHKELFNCTDNDQQYITARTVVENFIANRKIFAELNHYQQYGKILGKHPVFKLFKRIQQFRKMKFIDLVKLRKNLDHSIWRVKSEIEKGDRPDLLDGRLESIRQKEQELIEIDRILDQHA